MAIRIECVDLVKRFGPVAVLDHLSWTVEAGSLVGLVGGSGVGKTTLLRILAGLEPPSAGRVALLASGSGNPNRPPPIGMVFQHLALWPHLTARQHVRCVLSSLSRREREQRAARVFVETQLPEAAWDRRPAELSGGEAQRLALARALAVQPGLLLLDEPLAQVDTPLRSDLLSLIGEVVQARGMTAVYVTHAWPEAMQLCRRIAVLGRGRIEAQGTPEEVFWNPPSAQTAGLTGPVVELPRRLLDSGRVACPEGLEAVVGEGCRQEGLLTVRPQQLSLVEPKDHNQWKVAQCRAAGSGWLLDVTCETWQLTVPSANPLPVEQTVGLELRRPGSLHLPADYDKIVILADR